MWKAIKRTGMGDGDELIITWTVISAVVVSLALSIALIGVACRFAVEAKPPAKTIKVVAGDTLNVTISPSAVYGPPNLKVAFTGTATSSSGAAITTWTWNYGDGIWCSSGSFCGLNVTHIYPNIGTYNVVLTVADAAGSTATATAIVTIASSSPTVPVAENAYCGKNGQHIGPMTDGPASFWQYCFYTGEDGTPSPGSVVTVSTPTQATIQNALNSAVCGETILLPAGSQTEANLTFPALHCDAGHWITIKSNAASSLLPAESVRITPCYAGIASIPNRPAYSCPSPANVVAQLYTTKSSPVVQFAAGANYYRIGPGIEIAHNATGTINYGLVELENSDHVVLDRDFIHGADYVQDDKNGVEVTDATYWAVINSYLYEFKCVSITGQCVDGHGISGGDGAASVEGPGKIYNNFIEAATENLLFGGKDTGVATINGIEIRLNHLYKNPCWNPLSSCYVKPSPKSNGYVVKNNLEIKNAAYVLLEGNKLEYAWGGFTQNGDSVVVTPRGTWGQATNLIMRYNSVSHVGGGLVLAASKACDSGNCVNPPDSKAANNWSIHDWIVDDMNPTYYKGTGGAWQIGSAYTVNPPLHNVVIDHMTVFNSPAFDPASNLGHMMSIGTSATNPVKPTNISITNSILMTPYSPIIGPGPGLPCAKDQDPITTFNNCWASWTVAGNVLVGWDDASAGKARKQWPTGNYMTADPQGTAASILFTNFNGGNGGNYRLLSTSPYHNKANDGTDIGANVPAINAFLPFVQ